MKKFIGLHVQFVTFQIALILDHFSFTSMSALRFLYLKQNIVFPEKSHRFLW